METIGSKISKIRKQKGISQEELSDLSKINLRTLQRIEKDENQPSGKTLKLICETLQVNIEEIINYGKIVDNSYLMFLHLSIISNVIIPLGNIIFPLILWLNKRESIINLDSQGKNILNFQILFSIVSNLLFYVTAYFKISHTFDTQFLFYIYIVLIILNTSYSIYIAIKINQNKIKEYYINPIIFVK
jgi:transcriptional regulator with XRE-family HTH domain